MRLEELLRGTGVEVPGSLASEEVAAVTDDSRQVSGGTLFVAVTGHAGDGHLYAERALASGAPASVTERRLEGSERLLLNAGGDNRRLVALLAARLAGYPWRRMTMAGVTGTNGKTSTVRMLAWILRSLGTRTGVVGTVGHVIGGRDVPSRMTTPGPVELTRLVAEMAEAGDDACVMEVSSHALSQRRVEEMRFDVGLLTNISRDHLDYHASMEDYVRSKLHLFDLLRRDGRALAGSYAEGTPSVPGALTFGPGSRDDFRVSDVSFDMSGTRFTLDCRGERVRVELATPGSWSAMNAAGAMAAACVLGASPEDASVALSSFPGVPGRFQTVPGAGERGFLVAVDYAHTPDALARLLEQARELCEGRLVVVFGAGGDRDRGKRPLMGSAASRLADVAVVTSDNPRTEEPLSIIRGITAGMDGSASVEVIPDRREAIRAATCLLRPGDVLLIAGKGHEDYQVVGTRRLRFDDLEEAAAALEGRT